MHYFGTDLVNRAFYKLWIVRGSSLAAYDSVDQIISELRLVGKVLEIVEGLEIFGKRF